LVGTSALIQLSVVNKESLCIPLILPLVKLISLYERETETLLLDGVIEFYSKLQLKVEVDTTTVFQRVLGKQNTLKAHSLASLTLGICAVSHRRNNPADSRLSRQLPSGSVLFKNEGFVSCVQALVLKQMQTYLAER